MMWSEVTDEAVVSLADHDMLVPLWRLAQAVAHLTEGGEEHWREPTATWLPPDDWYEAEAARLRERAPA